MSSKTNKTKRKLSIVVLAASIAIIAIPAATAGGRYEAGLVPSKLGSPDPRDTALQKHTFSPSIVDRLTRSPDPRDSAGQGFNEPSMCAVHLYPCGVSDDEPFSVTGSQQQGSVRLPRGDDATFREIVREAAQEHGSAGFGNTTGAADLIASRAVAAPNYSHLPSEDRP